MEMRLRTAALVLLSGPLLVACSNEPKHDYSDKGTVVGATDSPRPAEKSSSPASAPGDATIAKSDLTAEQATLYADVQLFEAAAQEKAKAKEGGFGGSFGSFSDDEDPGGSSFSMPKPDGIQVAESYSLSWADGKVVSYELSAESGERILFEDGRYYVDVKADEALGRQLAEAVEQVGAAVDTWTTTHGEAPYIGSAQGGVELAKEMFGDITGDEVKLPLPDGITHGGYSSSGDGYQVTLKADSPKEFATLTRDGVSYTRVLEIV